MTFQYPLKLISPSPTQMQKSVLVFLLTYGGGLVGGDQVHLTIDVKPHAKLSIVTQGHTKIFKSAVRNIITRQQLHVTLEANSSVFTIKEGGSLCLLDWVSAGRTARGENWDLRAWSGRNEIWATGPDMKNKLLLRDNLLLEGETNTAEEKALRHKMRGLQIFGTLILNGPLVDKLAGFFMSEFAALPRIGARDFRSNEKKQRDSGIALSKRDNWRAQRLQQEKDEGILWSVAKVRGCTVVKFGAPMVESARLWLGGLIREDGTIAEVFGEDSLMCVR
ncbi:hypothetical protein ACMFMG_002297 [Clarireedia jacksonii]